MGEGSVFVYIVQYSKIYFHVSRSTGVGISNTVYIRKLLQEIQSYWDNQRLENSRQQ